MDLDGLLGVTGVNFALLMEGEVLDSGDLGMKYVNPNVAWRLGQYEW